VLNLAAVSASTVVPGVLGFLVVAGLGLALFFLLRSMNKHLSKVAGGPAWREDAEGAATGTVVAQDVPGNESSRG
jgi:hypothetical protein